MADIIRLLPDSIANKIAAGEVVQRPASMVKELMENSIDAGSTSITLVIKDAGKALVQVTDNGRGMSETDARMSFERHATSKIATSEDLFTIRTLGFRGEALASIGAVAQVEMRTKQCDEELGACLKVEGSEMTFCGPEALQDGTTILVKNLFFNVPARRNFLKSNPVETRHIIDEFQRLALSHHDVHFEMYQNDMETYRLPKGKLSQRIVGIFGDSYRNQLVKCSEETEHVRVRGYVGKPEFAKKTRGEQFFFVNGRYVRHPYLHHAVLTGFEGLIPSDCHPFYVLFIEIDPKHIDINVHPTKSEIKFDDERTMYAIMMAAVKKALGAHNIAPSLNFEADVNFSRELTKESMKPVSRDYANFKSTGQDHSNLRHWETLYQEKFPADMTERQMMGGTATALAMTVESQHDLLPDTQVFETRGASQLHGRYVLAPVKSGLMMIDQQGAHERILYEGYMNALNRKGGSSQQSLFPQTISLSASDFKLVMDMEEELKAIGFLFGEFGGNSIMINGVPSEFRGGSEKDLFEGLIEQFKNNTAELRLEPRENLARSLARRTAIRQGTAMGSEEMNQLIDRLFACETPNYTPGGRPVIWMLPLDEIETHFEKRR